MRRFVLLTWCTLYAVGCASPLQFMALQESTRPARDPIPPPGQWCHVQLKTEHVDRHAQELRFLWGRVERADDDTLFLVDVMEETRQISAQPLLRRIPYVSRLTTSVDSEVELLEKREIPRNQITGLMVVSEEMAAQTRQHLVPVGEKWARRPQGVDFDFVIPTP